MLTTNDLWTLKPSCELVSSVDPWLPKNDPSKRIILVSIAGEYVQSIYVISSDGEELQMVRIHPDFDIEELIFAEVKRVIDTPSSELDRVKREIDVSGPEFDNLFIQWFGDERDVKQQLEKIQVEKAFYYRTMNGTGFTSPMYKIIIQQLS